MKSIKIDQLVRPHLQKMKPYSSARDEYTGKSEVYLDANENPLGSVTNQDLSRYPDPHQHAIKAEISAIKSIDSSSIFIGNGSDEPIDLLIRAFCVPSIDNIITMPPTYGMYEVSANVNNVLIQQVPLKSTFQIDLENVLKAINETTKIIFTCNPNNPTGTRIMDKDILKLASSFDGLVVVDEAYIDFSDKPSFIDRIASFQNIVVLQTFSKAWGMAAARVGMLFGAVDIVNILNKIKPPYNVNQMSQDAVLEALKKVEKKEALVSEIRKEKKQLEEYLISLSFIQKIYPSDTNFILVKVPNPKALYLYLIDQSIIVRDRSTVMLCEGCLRITVGTEKENQRLIEAMISFNQ